MNMPRDLKLVLEAFGDGIAGVALFILLIIGLWLPEIIRGDVISAPSQLEQREGDQ